MMDAREGFASITLTGGRSTTSLATLPHAVRVERVTAVEAGE